MNTFHRMRVPKPLNDITFTFYCIFVIINIIEIPSVWNKSDISTPPKMVGTVLNYKGLNCLADIIEMYNREDILLSSV